jgi:hypothetical protein
MLDQLVERLARELFEVLFHVGFCGLASITNRHGYVFVIVAAGTSFENVSASLVNGSHQ